MFNNNKKRKKFQSLVFDLIFFKLQSIGCGIVMVPCKTLSIYEKLNRFLLEKHGTKFIKKKRKTKPRCFITKKPLKHLLNNSAPSQ